MLNSSGVFTPGSLGGVVSGVFAPKEYVNAAIALRCSPRKGGLGSLPIKPWSGFVV